MGILVKLIGTGIGLASEAISHRKASNTSKLSSNPGESSSSASASTPRAFYDEPLPEYLEVSQSYADELIARGQALPVDSKDSKTTYPSDSKDSKLALANESDNDTSSEEGDEEQWELDEAASPHELESDNTPDQTEAQIADQFVRNHPPPAYSVTDTARKGQLPCPVVIPQRRPRDKKRGFVRAYAPVLADCGIDQDTFLEFLKSFYGACKEDPWLNVVNMAAAGAGFVPNPIAMGVSIAVQFAVGVAMEVQRRSRTNSFLDRMNKEFFQPRGLYALIMTYKPESNSSHSRVDITQTISSYQTPATSSTRQTFKNLRLSSGKTYGELEMPEAAPLIFPALDKLAISTSPGAVEKGSKLKDSQKFVASYFDRRAQAVYAGENPTSSLAAGQHEGFKSRYADPNHPASSGSLVALLTGGKLNPKARKMERRERKHERREEKRERRAARRGREYVPRDRRRKGGFVKRILKKDVLYLMIVNMPTEEELQAGRESVAREAQIRTDTNS